MKNMALVFLFSVLALAGPCFGWAKGSAQPAEADRAAEAARAEGARMQAGGAFGTTRSHEPAAAAPAQRMVFPQQVVTRPLLEMIYQVNRDIKSIPYFLSDSITLAYSKTTQNLEISQRGEVTLREVTLQNQVFVDRNTAGTLAAVRYDAEGRMLLAVNFDESEDSSPLIFREDGRDRAFYLVHYVLGGTDRKMYYGQVLYDLQTGLDAVPRLQIHFEHIAESRPMTKTLRGRQTPLQPAEDDR
jgi:hypothetical protein